MFDDIQVEISCNGACSLTSLCRRVNLEYYVCMEKKQKTVHGNTIFYWESNVSAAKTILLVHGISGSHRGFYKIAPLLEKKYHLIIPDFSGFGESPLPRDDFSIEQQARLLNQFVKSLSMSTKPVLLGHSYGGMLSTIACQKNPSLYENLILISPPVTPVRLLDSRWFGAKLQNAIFFFDVFVKTNFHRSKVISKISTKILVSTKSKLLFSEIYSEHIGNLKYISSAKFYLTLQREINTTQITGIIETLPKKILLLFGNKDVVVPIQEYDEIKPRDNITKIEIDGRGHLLHYEEPERLASEIITFIG